MKKCVILGCGPSLNRATAADLEGATVIAVSTAPLRRPDLRIDYWVAVDAYLKQRPAREGEIVRTRTKGAPQTETLTEAAIMWAAELGFTSAEVIGVDLAPDDKHGPFRFLHEAIRFQKLLRELGLTLTRGGVPIEEVPYIRFVLGNNPAHPNKKIMELDELESILRRSARPGDIHCSPSAMVHPVRAIVGGAYYVVGQSAEPTRQAVLSRWPFIPIESSTMLKMGDSLPLPPSSFATPRTELVELAAEELSRREGVCGGCADCRKVLRDGFDAVVCGQFDGIGISLHGVCPGGRW